ncbi:MAG: DMT family transporter [Ferrovibrio sp.]|uniref:DMT family transporter n=1 Tax=Ferrovibrio sp. TaxID=1917215 RepID=UPI003918D6BA
MQYSRLDGLAIGLMTILCLCWGIQQVVIKITADFVSPLLQAGLRSAGAALLVWLWMAWRRIPLWQRDGSLWPGLGAGLLFGTEFGLLFYGLTLTSASHAAILLYTAPFWVALGSHLLIPGERIRRLQLIGLDLAFLGVLLTFAGRLQAPQPGELIGDALMVAAAILWAATTVLIKGSVLRAISPYKTLLYQLGVSGPLLLLGAVFSGESLAIPVTGFVIGSLAFQTVAVAAVSYLAWFWLMTRYPVSRLSAFSFLTPVFGVAGGALYLNEPLPPSLLGALALVALGIWLVNAPGGQAAGRITKL